MKHSCNQTPRTPPLWITQPRETPTTNQRNKEHPNQPKTQPNKQKGVSDGKEHSDKSSSIKRQAERRNPHERNMDCKDRPFGNDPWRSGSPRILPHHDPSSQRNPCQFRGSILCGIQPGTWLGSHEDRVCSLVWLHVCQVQGVHYFRKRLVVMEDHGQWFRACLGYVCNRTDPRTNSLGA